MIWLTIGILLAIVLLGLLAFIFQGLLRVLAIVGIVLLVIALFVPWGTLLAPPRVERPVQSEVSPITEAPTTATIVPSAPPEPKVEEKVFQVDLPLNGEYEDKSGYTGLVRTKVPEGQPIRVLVGKRGNHRELLVETPPEIEVTAVEFYSNERSFKAETKGWYPEEGSAERNWAVDYPFEPLSGARIWIYYIIR